MIKKTLPVLCLCVFLNASVPENNKNVSIYDYIKNQRNSLNHGNIVISNGKINDIIKEKHKNIDTYIDTTIVTDILNAQNSQNNVYKALHSSFLADNVSYNTALYNKRAEKRKKNINRVSSFYLKGYCEMLNSVKITASDGFSELECSLQDENGNYRDVNVFAKFMPDYQREILIAFPLYAKIDGKTYNAVGYFMNALKTSLNTASEIDSIKIKKLLAKGFLTESDIAYKQATAYLDDLRASRTQTSVTYIQDSNGNSTPVQSSVTQKPRARDYWTTGIVNGIAALVKMFGENELYNMTPLFKVNRGDVLYTEMIVKRGNKNSEFKHMKNFENNLNTQIKNSNVQYKNTLTEPVNEK